MAILARWYEPDTRFIAAHHQPAVLVELGLSRGISSHHLLRGVGLFYEDMLTGQASLSPAQFLTLVANSRRWLESDDTSFLFGQRVLPGHYGETSQVLHQAGNLGQALAHLCEAHALLSPWLTPRMFKDDRLVYLYWLDNCGAGEQHMFLVEAMQAGVVAMARWLSGQRLPWCFHFAHPEPRHVEQYWVHLGESLQFDQPLNMMSLPLDYLEQPWPNASPIAAGVAWQGSRAQLDELGFSDSLLDLLYVHLRRHIRQTPSLERVAQAFGMSPASLKRRLKKHGTHFQAQLDLVRMHVALYLFHVKGSTNEEVADYLCFNDVPNFRRSFKRWTGLPPSDLRQILGCA